MTATVALLLILASPATLLAQTQDERTAHLPPLAVEVGGQTATVVDADERTVTVTFDGQPGSRAVLPRERVPGEVLYALDLYRTPPRTAEDWLALADLARERGLLVRHLEALRAAQRADPSLELSAEIEQARQVCGERLLERANAQLDRGELAGAQRTLQQIMAHCAPSAAADEAQAMLSRLEQERASEQTAALARLQERRAARVGDDALGRAVQLIARGDDALEQGLSDTGAYTDAQNAFTDALDAYSSARAALEDVAATAPRGAVTPSGAPVESEHAALLRAVRGRLVRTHIELGHVYVSLGALTKASRHAGLAAALDPTDPSVASLRESIAARDRR